MENLSAIELIRKGFFIGLGVLIPFAVWDVALLGGSYVFVDFSLDGLVEEMEYELADPAISGDYTSEVVIEKHSRRIQGNQLLITGAVNNASDVTIESVQIEAELFDASGEFVYECTEYLQASVEAGESENFLIQCGCSENGLPEFDSYKLKVSNASIY